MRSKRKSSPINSSIYRTIDANFNRAREGLRVCEEFMRFVSNDRVLTGEFKKMRSRISRLYNNFLDDKKLFFSARDITKDVGKKAFRSEGQRSKLLDVFWANLNRSKEALRVIEEFSKLINKEFSDEFRRLRFKLYELEKKAFKKLQALPSTR